MFKYSEIITILPAKSSILCNIKIYILVDNDQNPWVLNENANALIRSPV